MSVKFSLGLRCLHGGRSCSPSQRTRLAVLLTLMLAVQRAVAFCVPPDAISASISSQRPFHPPLQVAAVEQDALASSSGTVEFPPPLSTLGRLQRAATFWSVAIPIVAQYYGLISKIKLQEILGTPLSSDQVEQLWQAQHEHGATKLADVVTDLKVSQSEERMSDIACWEHICDPIIQYRGRQNLRLLSQSLYLARVAIRGSTSRRRRSSAAARTCSHHSTRMRFRDSLTTWTLCQPSLLGR
jgi:hypothetical protein